MAKRDSANEPSSDHRAASSDRTRRLPTRRNARHLRFHFPHPCAVRLNHLSRLLPQLRLFVVAALVVVLVGFAPGLARGQVRDVIDLAPPDRSSPQAWISSFLAESAELEDLLIRYQADRSVDKLHAYSRQLDALHEFLDLDPVAPAFRKAVGDRAVTELIDIVNRLPITGETPAEPERGFGDGELPELWKLPGTGIVLARRSEGLDADNYVIPQPVISSLANIRAGIMAAPLIRQAPFLDFRAENLGMTGPLIPGAVGDAMGGWLETAVMGTPIWKLVFGVLTLAVMVWLNVVWIQALRAFSGRASEGARALLSLSGPFVLALTFLAFQAFVETQLLVHGSLALVSLAVRNVVVIAAAAWLLWTIVHVVIELIIGVEKSPDEKMDASLTRLIGTTLGVLGVVGTVVYGLSTLGVPTAGIITSLGVGGVGIAFAARVTIENLFGGLVLLIDRPFRIGDLIEFAAGEGVVTSIGGRSCRIRTAEGKIITVPNSVLAAAAIKNMGRKPRFSLRAAFPLPAEIGPDGASEKLSAVRAAMARDPRLSAETEEGLARLTCRDDGSVRIEISASVKAESPAEFDAVRTDVLMTMIELGLSANPLIRIG